jgi:hypothetical protein
VSSTSFISNVDANDIFMIHITCIGFSSGRDYFFCILYFFFPFVPGGFLEQKAAFEAKTRTDTATRMPGVCLKCGTLGSFPESPSYENFHFPMRGSRSEGLESGHKKLGMKRGYIKSRRKI